MMNEEKTDKKIILQTLWIFVTLNYIFCDVFTLMYHEDLKQILKGNIGGMEISQSFLLTFAILMEIPMVMIVLSRILEYKLNRLTNIFAGSILTIVQAGSLFADSNTLHYIFFSVIEITATLFIVGYAWKWNRSDINQ